jgi:hypothetical protein
MGIGRVRSAALASVKCRADGLLHERCKQLARRADPIIESCSAASPSLPARWSSFSAGEGRASLRDICAWAREAQERGGRERLRSGAGLCSGRIHPSFEGLGVAFSPDGGCDTDGRRAS